MDVKSGRHEIGPSNGKLLIRSFKVGLGAKLAHDWRLSRWSWKFEVAVPRLRPAGW